MSWLSRTGASLHSVVDAYAASHPASLAAIDDSGEWTYKQLADESKRLAAVLQAHGIAGNVAPVWSTQPTAPRPLALAMPRGRTWYALCLATWRLGVPLVAASDDMPDKKAEHDRNTRIGTELRPMALVVYGDPEAALPSRPKDCQVFQVQDLVAAAAAKAPDSFHRSETISPHCVLMYAYTGGTTKHSKCVVVTNAMALWEMDNYSTVLRGSISRSDRLLQYSPAYWGAAAFGQIDIALAFGACTVFIPAPANVDVITAAVSQYGITVLGTVPSQLRGAFPGGPPGKKSTVRVVLTWGEKLPVKLSREWKKHVAIIDLLIASEYWLAVYSDCRTWHDAADGVDKHILQPLPQLDMLLLSEDGSPTKEGQVGEMVLSGPTLSPGYVGPDGRIGTGKDNEAAFTYINGKLYYRSKDRLRKLPGGGLVYCGRGDSLAKMGGKWVDLEAMEASAAAVPGVAMAAIVSFEDIHLFVVLEANAPGPLCHLLERVKRAAGGECQVHVVTELPRNAATDKVDRKRLQQQLANASDREKEWSSFMSQKQWHMWRSYCSWYTLMFLILSVPTVAVSPWDSPWIVLLKTLLVPYLWANWQYSRMPSKERSIYALWLGPPDMWLTFASLLPPVCLGPVFAASFAFLCYFRHQSRISFSCFIFVVLFGALAYAGWYAMAHPASSVLICFITVRLLDSDMASFFFGLPVPCYLILPKLLIDDWSWRIRCDHTFFRKAVMSLLVRPKLEWDASLQWDFKQADAMWSDREGKSVVSLKDTHDGLAVHVDFRDEIWVPECYKKKQNGNTSHEKPTSWSPMACTLAGLVERVGGSHESLVGLDSLQAITLAELIRKEMGRDVNIKDLLRSTDVEQLAAVLQATPTQAALANSGAAEDVDGENSCEKPDASGSYRVFMLAFPRHPVDWMVKYEGPDHIDAEALQRACDRLVARHPALRTIESPDDCIREKMDIVAAMWQLWASCIGSDRWLWRTFARIVGSSLFACWPRTVIRPRGEAQVKLKISKGPEVREKPWDWATHDQYIFSAVREHTAEYRWPFDIALVPLYRGDMSEVNVGTCENAAQYAKALPPKDVGWYIFASITHGYSDGASGQAVYADLIRYYDEETGKAQRQENEPPMADPFKLLQRRLKSSLRGRLPGQSDPNNDVFHEVLDEDWGKRDGYSKRVYITSPVSRALRLASSDVLGCSVDIAWLTAVMGAVFRMFPSMPCFHIVLKCGCRDGPNERQMVGFLSEVRMFPVDVGDSKTSTLLHLAQLFSGKRRRRNWRAPVPYEQGICVYINVVSAMIDSLPKGFQHMPRPAGVPRKWRGPAYAHLNVRIDQLALNDWDFRIFHHDYAWGWEWSNHFTHALGGCIWDMVTAPTESLWLPPHRRAGGGRQSVHENNGGLVSASEAAAPEPTDENSRKRDHAEMSENAPDTAMVDAEPVTAEEPCRKRREISDGNGSAEPVEAVPVGPPEKAPRMGGGVEA